MAIPFDICIRGAGIVGRSLALQLAAKRLRVALVEHKHSNPAHSDVRAYALSPASRAYLQALRCWPDAQYATPVLAMQIESFADSQANGMVRFSADEQGVEALNWIVDVPTLEDLLAQAVRFQAGIEVVQQPCPALLTVVCEGSASATRTELGVEFETTPYAQSALAARLRCAMPHGQVARQWFIDGDVLALLPLGGAQGQDCALVWSLAPERALALQACAADEFCQQLVAASRASLGALSLISTRQVWPLQAAHAKRWTGKAAAEHGSWVLAGDAAHSVHPLTGQGLNLGLGDAAELVRVLETRDYWRSVDDAKLLRGYERARKAEHALIGGAGDALQRLFHQQQPVVQKVRGWGMQAFNQSGLLKNWVAARAMGQGIEQGTGLR